MEYHCPRIIQEIENERAIIQRKLVLIADRIQPLRGRRWEWVPRPNDARNYILQQTELGTDERKKLLAGQRGLSMRRIEQLESLRQRCRPSTVHFTEPVGRPILAAVNAESNCPIHARNCLTVWTLSRNSE